MVARSFRSSPRGPLQRQLLLWVGVAAVALSLLAMHQMSGNHTAAQPGHSSLVHLDDETSPSGSRHIHADLTGSAHAHSPTALANTDPHGGVLGSRLAAGADTAAIGVEPLKSTPLVAAPPLAAAKGTASAALATVDNMPAPCSGCAEHHAMAAACLVALTLLWLGWLMHSPARWPGLMPRRSSRTRPIRWWIRRWRTALYLVELSISRT